MSRGILPSALLIGAAMSLPAQGRASSMVRTSTTTDTVPRLVFRFVPLNSDTAKERQVFETLYRYLEPKTVEAAHRSYIGELIQAECGVARPIHYEMFKRANPSVDLDIPIRAGGKVAIPACPIWHDGGEITVPKGYAIDDVLLSPLGSKGPKTQAKVSALNPQVPMQAGRASTATKLTLPYETVMSSWAFRDEAFSPEMHFYNDVKNLPGLLAFGIDDGSLDLVRDVVPAAADATTCRPPAGAEPWPFDREEVLKLLQRNARNFSTVAMRPVSPVVVGIADTGIEPSEMRLPIHETAREIGGREDEDNDGNGYYHDVKGTNMSTSVGFPKADKDYARAGHGTGVAALAAGGVGADQLAIEVRKRFGLKILSIVRRFQDGDDSKPHFNISLDGVTATLFYKIETIPLSVVNLSIQSSKELGIFKPLFDYSTTLSVIAAGNDHVNVDAGAVYPAKYRSESKQKLITVASHDPLTAAQRAMIREGQPGAEQIQIRSSFSNWGPGTIDLAAPGCLVPTFGLGGALTKSSGTSFAAPLVSFTAALVMSEGLPTPQRARRRILASVDVVPALPVFTKGILNIPKALSIFEDLVEKKDGEIVRGRITGLKGVKAEDGTIYLAKRLLKIVPLKSGALRVFTTDDKDVVDIVEVPGSITQITITPTEGGAAQTIPLTAIADIVLADPEYRRW